MRKSTMIGLVKGNKIQHKKSGLVLTVITVTDEGVQCEEKFISNSNCTRWFDLYVEEVEQPVEPIKPTNTSEKTVEDEIPGETHTNSNNHVVEGKNSIEEIFHQFNKVLDEHNCFFKQNKEYIGCMTDRKKGTLLQLKPNRQGSVHIDLKKSVWKKLKDAYKVELEKTYSAYVYDKTRGYIRLRNMEDVNTFTVLLLTALS